MIEISLIPPNAPFSGVRAFQHLPPFLLVLSGLTFLSASEEQIAWIVESEMDSTKSANILVAGAFVIHLVAVALLELYEWSSAPAMASPSEGDLERAEGRRLWEDALARVGMSRERREERGYDAIPLSVRGTTFSDGSPRERERGEDGAVFEVGEDEDDGGDGYWSGREKRDTS